MCEIYGDMFLFELILILELVVECVFFVRLVFLVGEGYGFVLVF